MTGPLNLLLVEDSETDAELLLIELRRLGFEVNAERVDTGAALGAALEAGDWELVICDHGMPSFDSGDALEIVRSVKADLPFIVFSGSIGEEVAVEALRAGATDVVLKTNLARVGPVIDRALAEADNRRQRREAEAERASLEAQLRQAQKLDAIGNLVASITHDFNNMLAVVNGYSNLILRRLDEDDPLRPQITEMARAGEKAAALIRQLLAFSRQQVLELKVLQLNAVVVEIEPFLRRLMNEHIDLQTHLDPGLGLVRADSGQLEQVVMNLVVNARDAMPDGGTLTIETQTVDYGPAHASAPGVAAPEGLHAVLSVSDTGVGMDAATQDHIFEPFFTTKSAEHGTGLGLSTVYGIVNQSGGHIDVVSAPGAGTVFRIALPVVDGPAHGTESPVAVVEPSSLSDTRRGSATVLVVEDNEGVLHLVRELLESDGLTVLEARTGTEAIEVFNRDPGAIGLVITDMVMPGMSGADLAHRLRELEPGVRLLFMSGYSQQHPDDPGSYGLDAAVLQKPFAAADLTDKVRQLLDAPRPDSRGDVA